MGRARKRQLANAGGTIEKPNKPVDMQMMEDKLAKRKRVQIIEDGHDDDEKIVDVSCFSLKYI